MELDSILKEVGQFGKYQIINLSFLAFPILFTAYYSISYVFTAGDLNYRCLIPQCESTADNYGTPWLKYAIPKKSDNKFCKCLRYSSESSGYHSNCTQDVFSINVTEKCNTFVFESQGTTIVSDFKLVCDENKWKRTFVGTINNIGQFLGLPVTGFFSDRFGRKTTLIAGTFFSSIMGIARSYSPSYATFLTFELMDAIVSTGVYSGGFILGVELVGPEKRVLASAILSSFYSVGEIIMGLVMWYLEDWRQSLRALYIPGFLFIFYIWLVPESVRWLITKKNYKGAIHILHRMSKVNKKPFSEETKKALDSLYTVENIVPKLGKKGESEISALGEPIREEITAPNASPLIQFFKSPRMLIRFVCCSFCWITNTFVFYGLSLNSVAVAGNKYYNFILVSLAEVPGYFVTWLVMDVIGRRISLFLAFVLSGGSCLAFYFIPEDMVTTRLILFLTGKMAITASFTVIYVYTAEMFPTNARHSLLGSCSMFGRIGSMVAPQTPFMAVYINPLLLFGGISLVAGAIALSFPETLNTNLPDNVKEAEQIGTKARTDPT